VRAERDPDLEERFRAGHERAKALSASLAGPSLADELVELGIADPAAFEAILASLSTLDLARLCYAWTFWARPKQRPPALPRHRIVAWVAARGLGKSRAVGERVRERIEGGSMIGAFCGPTIEEIERYMLGGQASEAAGANGAHGVVDSALRVGILDIFPPHQRPDYQRDKGLVRFHTGAVYYLVSAKTPEFRGGNCDTICITEATKIRPTERAKLLSNAELALRARGPLTPEMLIDCTPTPDPWVRELVADPGAVVILGETEENAANLDDDFIARLREKFGNSRLGRQETKGEILSDFEGALFSLRDIDGNRMRRGQALPEFKRIAIAIDPAISTRANVDATGIVAAARGVDDRMYVLAAQKGVWTPQAWAEIALDLRASVKATAVVAERNRGGDMVKSVIELVAERRARARGTVAAVRVEEVQATLGKAVRAEEVQVLSETGRLVFPADPLVEIEDEITSWVPGGGGRSPNLLDALVWAAHYLYDGFGDTERVRDEQRAATVATFRGLDAAQEAMPAPAWGAPREQPDHEAEAAAWDRA